MGTRRTQENTMTYSQPRSHPATNFPYLTLLISAVALLLFSFNNAATWLQYDRSAIAAGEVWRIITSHWIHWSFDHFLWCVISFIALGAVCERLNRKGFILSVLLSAICIPVFSWFVDPAMELYRGLSGLCSTVFMVAALQMMRQALAEKNRTGIVIPACAVLLFLGKILFEFIYGNAMFVHNIDIFTPVPLVHLAGCVVGIIAVIFTGLDGGRHPDMSISRWP